MGSTAAVVVVGPEVYESARLVSLLLERLSETKSAVIVSSPPLSLVNLVWRFLHWRSPYGVDGLVKRVASHFASLSRALVGSEREAEIVRGEIARLSDEMRWLAWSIASTRSYTGQQAALLLSYPSRLAAAVTAASLRSMGLEALWLAGRETGLVGVGEPLAASIDVEASRESVGAKLAGLVERGVNVVVAGGVAGSQPGGVKLLGWGGELAAGIALASILGVGSVTYYYGEKGLEHHVKLVKQGQRIVSASSIALAASFRAVYFPPRLDKLLPRDIEIAVLGLVEGEARISHEGQDVLFTRSVTVYTPMEGQGSKDYCSLAQVHTPLDSLGVGVAFDEAPYCTNGTGGQPLGAHVAAGGPLEALEGMAGSATATLFVRLGRLALAVWPSSTAG